MDLRTRLGKNLVAEFRKELSSATKLINEQREALCERVATESVSSEEILRVLSPEEKSADE